MQHGLGLVKAREGRDDGVVGRDIDHFVQVWWRRVQARERIERLTEARSIAFCDRLQSSPGAKEPHRRAVAGALGATSHGG